MTAAGRESPAEPELLTLPGGQSRLHWLPTGTAIVVLEGRLMLTCPPHWLADYSLRLDLPLAAGDIYQLTRPGWWGLSADSRAAARLRLMAPTVPASCWSTGIALARQWMLALPSSLRTPRG